MTVVVLDPTLEEVVPNSWYRQRQDELTFEGYYSPHTRTKLRTPYESNLNFIKKFDIPEGAEREVGLLGMASFGYSYHVPIAIAPHDIWFLMMTELAELIESNVEPLRPLFTNSPDKTEIAIGVGDPTDLTGNIDLFEAELRKLVPVDISTYVPEFSTHTRASRVATMAAFMDGMKVYYSYSMFCCGLPSVKIQGTIDDWQLLAQNLGIIGNQFQGCGVSVLEWFGRVQYIVSKIVTTLQGQPDIEWWKNIFSQRNIGSGGEKEINGWITHFYRNPNPRKLETFGTAWAAVPFKNLHEPDKKYTSIHGALLRTRDADGFLNTGYADFTVITEPKTAEQLKPNTQFEVVKTYIGGNQTKTITTVR